MDFDPLLLLPVVLIAMAVAGGTASDTVRRKSGDVFFPVLVALPLVAHLVSGHRGPSSVYFAALVSMCIATIYWTAIGAIPNVWRQVYRMAPYAGAGLSAYGIYQFYELPPWDRTWMVASGLLSIGKPLPTQVRVFGSSEAPGPFAFLLVVCLICAIFSLADRQIAVASRMAVAAAIPLIGFALILTGVRTAIVGLVVAVALTAGRTMSLKLWLIVGSVSVIGYVAIGNVLAAYQGSDNSILDADRYNLFSITSDSSFESRADLLGLIGPAFADPLGTGYSPNEVGRIARYDNTYVDILVHVGPIAMILVVWVFASALAAALKRPAAPASMPEWALRAVVVVVVVNSLASNVLSTTTGLAMALFVGMLFNEQRSQRVTSPVDVPARPEKLRM